MEGGTSNRRVEGDSLIVGYHVKQVADTNNECCANKSAKVAGRAGPTVALHKTNTGVQYNT